MKLWDYLCNIDSVHQMRCRSTRLTVCVPRLGKHVQSIRVWDFCMVRSLAITLCLAIPDRCTVPLTLPGHIFSAKRLNISGETQTYGNLFPASSRFEKQGRAVEEALTDLSALQILCYSRRVVEAIRIFHIQYSLFISDSEAR